MKHYLGLFRVEKITGSRLHMYVENYSVPKTFEIVAKIKREIEKVPLPKINPFEGKSMIAVF